MGAKAKWRVAHPNRLYVFVVSLLRRSQIRLTFALRANWYKFQFQTSFLQASTHAKLDAERRRRIVEGMSWDLAACWIVRPCLSVPVRKWMWSGGVEKVLRRRW